MHGSGPEILYSFEFWDDHSVNFFLSLWQINIEHMLDTVAMILKQIRIWFLITLLGF